VLALPYGGGGNTTAYGKGFLEAGSTIPRILAVQASDRSTTVASAIRIAQPIHADEVDDVIRRTEGAIVTVPDEALLEAWRLLAGEGVFCEPASAASIAGLFAADIAGSRVVCVITGHGLKDPETATRHSPQPAEVEPDADAIAAAAV
jgi:threonine synthase